MIPLAPCIVLAEGSRASVLHVARSLGSRGVLVDVGAVDGGEAVFRASRYCRNVRVLPSNEANLVRALLDWHPGQEEDRMPIVLPTSDRLVALLRRELDALTDRFQVVLPAAKPGLDVLDKASVLALAENLGIDVPRWIVVSAEEQLSQIHTLTTPLIIKPADSLRGGCTYFKFEIHQAHQSAERSLRRHLRNGARLIAQEYIPGPDSAVESHIFYRSSLSGTEIGCTVRKLRQDAPGGGVMAWGEAVDLPDVSERSRELVDGMNFTGLGGTEFKRFAGKLWFIELNPRLEAIHFLAMRAGVDLPWGVYADAVLGIAPAPVTPHRAAGWLGAAWVERVRRDGRIGIMIIDFLKFLTYRRRTFGVLSLRDPLPWLALQVGLAKRLIRNHLPARGRAA